mmetsp:Transcript_20707/g.62995  ORF Transcript_20707/g.62995 Transcript_20707/m.62995 type:complete len:357 (+) Transcript_20707:417-1487(+)
MLLRGADRDVAQGAPRWFDAYGVRIVLYDARSDFRLGQRLGTVTKVARRPRYVFSFVLEQRHHGKLQRLGVGLKAALPQVGEDAAAEVPSRSGLIGAAAEQRVEGVDVGLQPELLLQRVGRHPRAVVVADLRRRLHDAVERARGDREPLALQVLQGVVREVDAAHGGALLLRQVLPERPADGVPRLVHANQGHEAVEHVAAAHEEEEQRFVVGGGTAVALAPKDFPNRRREAHVRGRGGDLQRRAHGAALHVEALVQRPWDECVEVEIVLLEYAAIDYAHNHRAVDLVAPSLRIVQKTSSEAARVVGGAGGPVSARGCGDDALERLLPKAIVVGHADVEEHAHAPDELAARHARVE